jgi:hypothetical protein
VGVPPGRERLRPENAATGGPSAGHPAVLPDRQRTRVLPDSTVRGADPSRRRQDPHQSLAHRRPGTQPGWTDLLVTPASDSAADGDWLATAEEKKYRTIYSVPKTLEKTELVRLPNAEAPRGVLEDFRLLNERGPGLGANVYRVPVRPDDHFTVPAALFTRGWIHVLEDAELALLLMQFTALIAQNFGDRNEPRPFDP